MNFKTCLVKYLHLYGINIAFFIFYIEFVLDLSFLLRFFLKILKLSFSTRALLFLKKKIFIYLLKRGNYQL
jgi:hypothetical protein